MQEFANDGYHFASAYRCEPEQAMLAEKQEVAEFYQSAFHTAKKVGETMAAMAAKDFGEAWRAGAQQPAIAALVDAVAARALQFGAEVEVATIAADDEEERELENERQQENEEERAEVKQRPHKAGDDWDIVGGAQRGIEALLAAAPGAGLPLRLSQFVERSLHPDLASIPWQPQPAAAAAAVAAAADRDIWLTADFASTIIIADDGAAAAGVAENLDSYLRPLEFYLCLADGTVLLLSGREADHVLEALHTAALHAERAPIAPGGNNPAVSSLGGSGGKPWLLLFHAFARAEDPAEQSRLAAELPGGGGAGAAAALKSGLLGSCTIARLQLLAGETRFGKEKSNPRQREVAKLLQTQKARAAALKLPGFRGQGHLVHTSRQLDDVCGLRRDDA